MGVRDEEMNRLKRYAQGMGISISIKPFKKGGDSAAWTIDGSAIELFMKKRTTKINEILSLIHELAHHKAFVANGRAVPAKVDKALDGARTENDRKVIYEMERDDSAYWEDIYHDTHCTFPIKWLYKQKEFDVWNYEVYYKTGKFPTKVQSRKKFRELSQKWGKK